MTGRRSLHPRWRACPAIPVAHVGNPRPDVHSDIDARRCRIFPLKCQDFSRGKTRDTSPTPTFAPTLTRGPRPPQRPPARQPPPAHPTRPRLRFRLPTRDRGSSSPAGTAPAPSLPARARRASLSPGPSRRLRRSCDRTALHPKKVCQAPIPNGVFSGPYITSCYAGVRGATPTPRHGPIDGQGR